VAQNTIEENVMSFLLLFGRHGQAFVDGICNTEEIVGIDGQGGLERGRSSHELGEDKGRLVGLVLTKCEFHRGGVHTVSERSDEREVGDGEETEVFVSVDGLVAACQRSMAMETR
jgi:hypothetical protein